MRCLALLVLATTACAEPAVELAFRYPDASGFDLSCVASVRVYALGTDAANPALEPDVEATCIDLPQTPGSFADVVGMLRDRVTIAMPESGLAALEVVGAAASCANPNPAEAIFYGGAPYGGDGMTVALAPNLSCSRTRSYETRALDFLQTVATKQCTPAAGLVAAGDMRPLLLGDAFAPMTWELGASAADTQPDGTATINSFVSAEVGSCVAAGFVGADRGGGGCVNLGPSLCGTPDQVDIPVMTYAYAGVSRDDALYTEYGEPVIGAVFEVGTAATKTAIGGATVELADPAQGEVVYVQRGANKLEIVAGARGTNADGLFMVYLRGPPTAITITSTGHKARTFVVASAPESPVTMFAALEKSTP